MNTVTKYKFHNWSILIFFTVLSLLFAWFIYGMGGAFLAESFNLYTHYDGEILFDDSAMMNWKHAFLIGMVYYLLIMSAFYSLLKSMNLESKQRNKQMTVLAVFNLLVCFGIVYILSTPFIS